MIGRVIDHTKSIFQGLNRLDLGFNLLRLDNGQIGGNRFNEQSQGL